MPWLLTCIWLFETKNFVSWNVCFGQNQKCVQRHIQNINEMRKYLGQEWKKQDTELCMIGIICFSKVNTWMDIHIYEKNWERIHQNINSGNP